MTYGTHTDLPCYFSRSFLLVHLLILNSHPLLPNAFSTLSAPPILEKQGKQRNPSHSTSLDVDISETYRQA